MNKQNLTTSVNSILPWFNYPLDGALLFCFFFPVQTKFDYSGTWTCNLRVCRAGALQTELSRPYVCRILFEQERRSKRGELRQEDNWITEESSLQMWYITVSVVTLENGVKCLCGSRPSVGLNRVRIIGIVFTTRWPINFSKWQKKIRSKFETLCRPAATLLFIYTHLDYIYKKRDF